MEGWQARVARGRRGSAGARQPHPGRGPGTGRLITVSSYQVELDLTGGETTFPSVTVARFRVPGPGSGTFINLTAPKVLEITLNGEAGSAGRVRRRPDHADRPGRRERAAGGGGVRLLAQRRGPAPVHRPGRRRRLPVLRPGDVRRAPDLRLLRPARPEGDLRADRHRAGGLAGHLEHGAGRSSRSPAGEPRPSAGTSRRPRSCPPTSPRSRPARTTWCGTTTTASRWASTAGSRWPSTSTLTRSSRSPSRASTSTTRRSASGTRSASTTSSSCPSSRKARWRTRAA